MVRRGNLGESRADSPTSQLSAERGPFEVSPGCFAPIASLPQRRLPIAPDSKGEWERAARFYLDALGSDPAVPELWLQLGHSLKAAGKSLEAEFAYGRAAALQS